VIRAPGNFEPSAVSREHYSIARPKRPCERNGDWSSDRAKTGNVVTIHVREQLRQHRAANADD
jgi:hypothetical protein